MTSSPLRSFSLVWCVPVIALVVSGWLLLREFRQRGPIIEIAFADGGGIEAGKTPLVHKGVEVGLVQEVALTPALDGVTVTVELDASAAPLAVEGSEFWLVHPEIGLSGVSGLETLLSGAQLNVRAGDGAPRTRFQGLAKAPPHRSAVSGRTFVLTAEDLGSLTPGAPIFYRGIKVGVVERNRLSPDARQVLIDALIYDPYAVLVRAETQFWNAGGISLKVGLLGAQVHSNSLESLVSGGVAFATPEAAATTEPAAEGTVFALHDEPEKSWLKWAPVIEWAPLDALPATP